MTKKKKTGHSFPPPVLVTAQNDVEKKKKSELFHQLQCVKVLKLGY